MEKTLERLRPLNSRQNSLVKELRRAFSRGEATAEGYIAVEGFHIVEEALRSGVQLKAVFFSQSARQRAGRLLSQLGKKVDAVILPESVFSSAVSTQAPQGVAALLKLKSHSLDDLLTMADPLLLACVGLQDPGNLGTIIRSAEAFGASGVLLGEKTVSPFNPKVVRSAAGSLLRLPVVKAETASALHNLRAGGIKLIGTSAQGGMPVSEADLRGKVTVFIGSEGAGLGREIIQQMDEVITIPHSPKVDSLNAAMAASIVLYEAARQKNYSPQSHRDTEK